MPTNSSAIIVSATPPAPTNAAAVPPALRDIKPPVEIPDYWIFLWVALTLIALGIVAFLLWKYWLKKALATKAAPPIPAHVRARRRLREATAYINDPKRFVGEVSDTIRYYLEESFNLRAPERTTEEFLFDLQKSSLLEANVKQTLNDFLSRCDLVKFARYEPTQMELEELHSVAMRIVEETEPKPVATAIESQARQGK